MNNLPDFHIQLKFCKTIICLFQKHRYSAAVPIIQKGDYESLSWPKIHHDHINFTLKESKFV